MFIFSELLLLYAQSAQPFLIKQPLHPRYQTGEPSFDLPSIQFKAYPILNKEANIVPGTPELVSQKPNIPCGKISAMKSRIPLDFLISCHCFL